MSAPGLRSSGPAREDSDVVRAQALARAATELAEWRAANCGTQITLVIRWNAYYLTGVL